MKLRFSLKLLLIAVTATALFCFWRTRPAANAARFAAALEAEDFAAADQLVSVYSKPPKTDHRAFECRPFPDWRTHKRTTRLAITAHFNSQSLGQWLTGRCVGTLKTQFDGTTGTADIVATTSGVQVSPVRLFDERQHPVIHF